MGHHTGLRERITESSRSAAEISMASGDDYVGLYGSRFGAPPTLNRASSREDTATAMAAVQHQQQQHRQHHLNTAIASNVETSSQGGASIVAYVGGQLTVHGLSNRSDGSSAVGNPYQDSVVGLSSKYNRDSVANLKELGIGIDHHHQHHHHQQTQALMRTNSMEAAAAVAMQHQTQTQQQSSHGDHDQQHQAAAAAVQMNLLRQRAVGLGSNNAATTSTAMVTTAPTTHLPAGSIACQDCGNQAKKDCAHMRCRTCCKTRGFDCPTHVKSTWVPAAKRRERQQAEILVGGGGGGGGQFGSQFYNNRPPRSKRARTLSLVAAGEHPGFGAGAGGDPGAGSLAGAGPNSQTSTSTGTPPRCSSDINSEGMYKGSLPAEYRTQAIFRCVKVTGIADGQDEYAYQTVVKIGGRIFKGILYDQGMDRSSGFSQTNLAELQLGGRAAPSTSTLMDLEGIYGNSGNPMLGGDLLPR